VLADQVDATRRAKQAGRRRAFGEHTPSVIERVWPLFRR
jgi:hypothetical protein